MRPRGILLIPPLIRSQSSIVLLLTFLETTDSPSVSLETHTNSHSPPKRNNFPPAPPLPQAIKITLSLSLVIHNLSPKRINFLNDLPPPNPTFTYNLVICCLNF